MIVHFDISQLVHDPRRSGIQRAQRELIRHWPGPARLIPCRFDPTLGALRALPDAVFGPLCADAPPGGTAAEKRLLQPHLAAAGCAVERAGARVLCAELFPDAGRAVYYQRFGAGAYWVVYDFLPWLHPEWFGAGSAGVVMPYLLAMPHVERLAFISEATRTDYARRILRRPYAGTVIPMGGDGLGLERQTFDPASRDFVFLGTIEPRKNALPVMQAFRRLWDEGADARLTMIGGMPLEALDEAAMLRALASEPRFRHLRGASDAQVRAHLAAARAMLFPSEGEGYGIPPMEALHAGIPVVVSAGLPALAGMPELGQIRLATISPATIADAVRSLLDDTQAARLWAEAARLQVPTWRDFAHAVAAWVQGDDAGLR